MEEIRREIGKEQEEKRKLDGALNDCKQKREKEQREVRQIEFALAKNKKELLKCFSKHLFYD